ncbi:hypothetical protein BJF78_09885 [Pseudonocardia sp. CNS-139]|nr:hypothetical protein BJF78_09885 [Pseudonocardia sp. CNS-139]
MLALLRVLRADPRLAAWLSAAAVAGFVVLARPSPSVVRAAAMAAVVLLALAMGRGRSAVPALATAVLALLLADPALAVDPGFALSVLATAALVLVAPGWVAALRRRRVPAWAAEALAVPAAAFLATAPLVAALNGEVNPVAVVANLLAVPAVAPATVLGVLAAVVSPVWMPPAQACAWLAGLPVGWLVVVADRSAAVPGSVLPWPDGLPGAALLAGVVLALLAMGRSPRSRAMLLAVALGLALVLVPTRVVRPGWPPTGWTVVACDVGQGDALVLATGRPGWVVLVDAGPEDGPVDACLDRLGVQGLAMVVLSHLHADHFGGLAGALRDRPVSAVAVGPLREPRWALAAVAAAAAAAGPRWSRSGRGNGWSGRRSRSTCSARCTRRRRSTPRTAPPSTTGRSCCAPVPRPAPPCSPATSSSPRRPTWSPRAPTCGRTCSRCRITAAATPRSGSSTRWLHGRCWSAWAPATGTGIPTPGCSAGWPGRAPPCSAPTSAATSRSWPVPAGRARTPAWRSSRAATRCRPAAGSPARDDHHAQQPRPDVRADHRTHLRHHQPAHLRQPLPQPRRHVLRAVRGAQVVHGEVGRARGRRLHREVHQALRRAGGGAHLLQRHDPAVHDVQERLHRERRAHQRGRGADPAAATEPVEGVDGEEHPAPVRHVGGGRLHGGAVRAGVGGVCRGEHGVAEAHAGGPGVDHPHPVPADLLGGEPGRLPGAESSRERCTDTTVSAPAARTS